MSDGGKVVTPAIEVDPEEVDVEVVLAEEIEVGDRVLVEYEESWWLVPLNRVVNPKPRYVFEAEWPSDDEYPRVLKLECRGPEEVLVVRDE